jgi:hypothetical protein
VAGMMPGGMQGMAGGMMPGGMPAAMPAAPPGPPQMGSQVMAQWQDGNWHPGVVVAMQNGMYGVDWTNPALGQSSWVYPQQVQAQPMSAPGMMPGGMPGQPAMMHQQHQAPMAHAKPAHDPYAKKEDPYAAKKAAHDPYAKKEDPYAAKGGFDGGKQAQAAMPAKGGGGALGMGSHVLAQWQDGNWHPGVVVAMQNGMYGVDWADPKLGQSSWVQPHQVRPK